MLALPSLRRSCDARLVGRCGYLLQTEPADPDTILAVIMDGMGIYFVAKGFFVGPMLWKQIDEVESLRALREYAAAEGEARRVRGTVVGADR